jgi:hypothetical protein
MNFSSILDISSFFIGMIVNLLLVALVSFFFKRRCDHLEKSINEHSEHIYTLLKKERDALRNIERNQFVNSSVDNELNRFFNQTIQYPSVATNSKNNSSGEESSDDESETTNNTDIDEIDDLNTDEENEVDDVDEDSEERESNEDRETKEEMIENIEEVEDVEEVVNEIKTIQEMPIEEPITSFNIHKVESLPQDYNKLTMKQLKDLLSNKGIVIKPHMKKNDLIDLASKNSLEIDNVDTEVSNSRNPSHISLTDCEMNLTNLNDTNEITVL